MKNLTIYRIASYILLPFGGLMGFASLIFLLIALANPALLLPVFMMVCAVIYIFASFSFLQKIDNKATARPGMKDLVKVNAFVALLLVANILSSVVAAIVNPTLLNQTMDNAMAMQGKNTAGVTPEMMQKAVKGMLYFMGAFGLILLYHILTTFRLLKQYAGIFTKQV